MEEGSIDFDDSFEDSFDGSEGQIQHHISEFLHLIPSTQNDHVVHAI